jgi:hypothetical protein
VMVEWHRSRVMNIMILTMRYDARAIVWAGQSLRAWQYKCSKV